MKLNNVAAERIADYHGSGHQAFQPEGQISPIPEDGHFEQVKVLDVRNAVGPAGKAEEIPRLPEATTDECRQCRYHHGSPVAFLQRIEKGGAVGQSLYGEDDYQGRYPQQGKELIGEDADQGQSAACGQQEDCGNPPGGWQVDGPAVGQASSQGRKGQQQFDHAEHAGKHRSKSQAGEVAVFGRPHALDAGVIPVLDESVEVLENPPEPDAGRKEQHKTKWSA